jgi:S-disulfanyl-L-cysteine oxidoreductase SoxD
VRAKSRIAAAIVFAGTLGLLTAQTTRSVRDGVYSEEQARRGRTTYSEHCLECHGRDLSGDVENRPLAGGIFFSNWDGTTMLTLFDRVRITMPGDKPGTLDRQQIADILAFVMQFNGLPAGSTDLSTRAEILQQIRIETPKR